MENYSTLETKCATKEIMNEWMKETIAIYNKKALNVDVDAEEEELQAEFSLCVNGSQKEIMENDYVNCIITLSSIEKLSFVWTFDRKLTGKSFN